MLWLTPEKHQGKLDPVIEQIYKKPQKQTYLPIMGPLGSYQADLMFLDLYEKKNSGHRIILNIIDVNSRYLYSFALKSKSDTYECFKFLLDGTPSDKINPEYARSLIEQKRAPIQMTVLTTDAGTEFVNKRLMELFKSHNIEVRNTKVKTHVGLVERVNKTLRDLIERNMTITDSLRWIDDLPTLVQMYNSTRHSTTKVAPINYTDRDFNRMKTLQINQYKARQQNVKNMFPIGSLVRVLLEGGPFDKSALPRYSLEIYEVIDYKPPIDFIIKNLKTNKTHQYPYSELRRVSKVSKPLTYSEDKKELKKEKKFVRLQRKSGLDVNKEGEIVQPIKPAREKREIKRPARYNL